MDDPDYAQVPKPELERLRRIEEAARRLLVAMEGRRSATPTLAAIAELRASLSERSS